MSLVIYKFPLQKVNGVQHVPMPTDAQIVHIDAQNGIPCIWAICNQVSKDTVERQFHIVGTGWPLPDGCVHRGTYQEPPFVWHLIELPL